MWNMYIRNKVSLKAFHLLGVRNTTAGSLGWDFEDHQKWSVRKDTLLEIFHQLGYPKIDLFITHLNNKCKKLFLLQPEL